MPIVFTAKNFGSGDIRMQYTGLDPILINFTLNI